MHAIFLVSSAIEERGCLISQLFMTLFSEREHQFVIFSNILEKEKLQQIANRRSLSSQTHGFSVK